MSDQPALRHQWTFLSNYAHVLICLARDHEARVRDVASAVGITERAVQRILLDLSEAGGIERIRTGRRNHYRLHRTAPLRHPLEADCTVGDLLDAMVPPREAVERAPRAREARRAGTGLKSSSR